MPKVQVRVIYGSLRRKGVGEIVSLSRRDARLLTSLGRVEVVDAAANEAEPKARKAPKQGTPVKRAKARPAEPKAKKAKRAKD
jgi:hypothetical protein